MMLELKGLLKNDSISSNFRKKNLRENTLRVNCLDLDVICLFSEGIRSSLTSIHEQFCSNRFKIGYNNYASYSVNIYGRKIV